MSCLGCTKTSKAFATEVVMTTYYRGIESVHHIAHSGVCVMVGDHVGVGYRHEVTRTRVCPGGAHVMSA